MDLQHKYNSMAAELKEFDTKHTLEKLPPLLITWRKNWIKRMEHLKNKI